MTITEPKSPENCRQHPEKPIWVYSRDINVKLDDNNSIYYIYG